MFNQCGFRNPKVFGCFVLGVGNYRTAKVYTFVTAGVGTKMANFFPRPIQELGINKLISLFQIQKHLLPSIEQSEDGIY
ncbi:hypothetical protein K443DRAFT_674696, partial [Laccaria amethystina LaAM-08-1]